MRRIFLDSQDFLQSLSDLSFVQKDGLWIPPEGIATGAIGMPQPITAEAHDLGVRLELLRLNSNGTIFDVLACFQMPIRAAFSWRAVPPDAAIQFGNGKRLIGFNLAAHIV